MLHRLNLLGTPELRTSTGELVDFPVGKPLALLSYLVLEAREVRRDDLSHLLWPDSPPDRARHSVRQAIWLIRRKLGEEVIEGEDPVRVSGEALACDVDRFGAALKAGELDEARGLWRGPLLSRLSLSDCRAWEHWREEQRELIRRRFFEALMDRARGLMTGGGSEEALPYLLEAVELNPYALDARALQVEALLEMREVPAARQALEEAKRDAGDAVGAEAALEQLEGRLRVVQTRVLGEASERLGESVEFVGRAGELSDLVGLWKRARGGRSGVACVLGATGIGKTRLAVEFLWGVEEEGGLAARVKGYRGEHRIPWGTVTDLVRQLMSMPGARGISSGSETVLRGVLPSLWSNGNGGGSGADSGVGEVQPAALSDAVLDLVEAVAFEEALAVFVDDWQWVDKESRSLLGKVMRRARGLACLFLLAERTGERRLGQEGAESVVGGLGGRRIVLDPLGQEELGELLSLLAEFTGPEDADELIGRIHRVTGGNPLFVGEVLRKLADEGVYRWEEGRWVLAVEGVPKELDLPESVQELIRERLGRLSGAAVQVASALAKERRKVPAGVLRRRAGVDEAVFTRAIGELLDREVVGWVGPKELDFTHDQLRDAARLFEETTRWGQWWATVWRKHWILGVWAVGALSLSAIFVRGERKPGFDILIPATGLSGQNGFLHVTPGQVSFDAWDAPGPEAVRSNDGRFVAYLSESSSGLDLRVKDRQGDEILFPPLSSDDKPLSWSPNSRTVAYYRGLLEPETGAYKVYFGTWNPLSGTRTEFLLEGFQTSPRADWSPDGTRIAVSGRPGVRVLDPQGNLWLAEGIDDGLEYTATWSPRGRSLAVSVLTTGGSDLYLLDRTTDWKMKLVVATPGRESTPVWLSEDLIAAVSFLDGHNQLLVFDRRDSSVFPLADDVPLLRLLSGVPAQVRSLEEDAFSELAALWEERTPTPLDSISLVGPEAPVSPGEYLTYAGVPFSTNGEPLSQLELGLRWGADGTVIEDLGGGRFKVLREGVGEVRLEQPGWRSVSMTLEAVWPSKRDLNPAVAEDWSNGLEDNWWGFGDPLPVVLPDAGPGGGPAFKNNGDQNYSSGVLSRQAFPVAGGVTVETELLAPFTGNHFQGWRIGFVPADSARNVLDAIPRFPDQSGVHADGFENTIHAGFSPPPSAVPLPPDPQDWHRYALQLSPTGEMGFYVDGGLYHRGSVDLTLLGDSVHIMLGGGSVGIDVLNGPTFVYAGALYGFESRPTLPTPPGRP